MASARPLALAPRRRTPIGKDYVPASVVSPWARLPRPGIGLRVGHEVPAWACPAETVQSMRAE